MRSVSLANLTGQAWRQMIALLFRPFRLTVWLKVLLIAWVAGQLAASLNLNFNLPTQPQKKTVEQAAQTEPPTTTEVEPNVASDDTLPQDEETVPESEEPKSEAAEVLAEPKKQSPMTYTNVQHGLHWMQEAWGRFGIVIALGVVAYLAFLMLWLWLQARMGFVFVDVVTTGKVAVIEPFKRYREPARSYFKWLVGCGFVSLGLLVMFVWSVGAKFLALYAQTPETPIETFLLQHVGTFIWTIVGWILCLWLPLSLLWIWSVDFIVPIMQQRGCTVLAAWRAYGRVLARSPWEAVLYLLWKLLLNILVGIVWMLAVFAFVLGLVLVCVVVGLLGLGLAKLLPILTIPLIIFGVIALLSLMLTFTFAIWLVQVPPAVWFRIFSLRYLQALGMGYQFFEAEAAASSPS